MGDCRHEKPETLYRFFDPQSIAVIGSLREGVFGGYVVVKSLIKSGYEGRIFPVNPGYTEVHGLKAYKSINEIAHPVDLAIIMTNARAVPSLLTECAEESIRAVVVVSDGFAERDMEGAMLQNEIARIARYKGIRILGPNTAGVASSGNGFNPCPYEAGYYSLKKGPLAICSQTGMTNPQAYPYHSFSFGTSKICDFGNKCDVDECDMLEYLGADDETGVVSMYLEGIADGERFLEVSRRVTSRKPVLILKSGRTQKGARASESHTGSLAVDDRVFDSVCRQAGILRLDLWSEIFEVPKIFAVQPLPKGNRLAIVSYTGGVGVLAIDKADAYGLGVADLTPETAGMLHAIFPGLGKIPVDIGPAATAMTGFLDMYPRILGLVLADPNVDSLFNVLWADPTGRSVGIYLRAYEQLKGEIKKPLASWIYGPDPSIVSDLKGRLEGLGFPVFGSPETAVRALGMAYSYASYISFR
jgi:acyl-CoA synthetase (NDP forming)